MKDTNRVLLIGHVAFDVAPHQANRVSFMLVTEESWKEKDTEEDNYRLECHWVMCFGQLAKRAKLQVKRGDRALVTGAIQTNYWTDKAGVEQKISTIHATSIRLIEAVKAREGNDRKT